MLDQEDGKAQEARLHVADGDVRFNIPGDKVLVKRNTRKTLTFIRKHATMSFRTKGMAR